MGDATWTSRALAPGFMQNPHRQRSDETFSHKHCKVGGSMTIVSRNGAVARLGFFAVLAMHAASAQAAEPTMTHGRHVTYRDSSGATWCATVRAAEVGVGAAIRVWITIDADPRRVVKASTTDLVDGCTASRLAAIAQ
jgi:hypothetical protein